jgi:hypothetical protein
MSGESNQIQPGSFYIQTECLVGLLAVRERGKAYLHIIVPVR